jgi:regulatory protein
MRTRSTPKPTSPEACADPVRLRSAAIACLARRDFSAADLRAKLQALGFEGGASARVVAELAACGVLNEARYAQNYVSWHAARGQGPLRIGADLRRQGVTEGVIDAALLGAEDWLALACATRRARFGSEPPSNGRDQARQARFLQYRGFSADHIRAATGADPDWNEGL